MRRLLSSSNFANASIDTYAAEFLTNSLPPISRLALGFLSAADVAEVSWADLVVAPRAQYSMRLLPPVADTGDNHEPHFELWTNTLNGRSFASNASPHFEVLPHLRQAVLGVIAAVPGVGVLVSSLKLQPIEERDDFLGLVELLVEHGALDAWTTVADASIDGATRTGANANGTPVPKRRRKGHDAG
jgi:hypothetical protein